MNKYPRRDAITAGAETANSEQSQCTGSPPSFQPIANAIAEVSEACKPIDTALTYGRAGLRVFPCDPRDKTPLVARGYKAATRDPKQIRAWWTQWPNAMIALATGVQTGIFVLDVDVDLEKGIDGSRRWPRSKWSTVNCWKHCAALHPAAVCTFTFSGATGSKILLASLAPA